MIKITNSSPLKLTEDVVPKASRLDAIKEFQRRQKRPDDLDVILFYSRRNRKFEFLDTLAGQPSHAYVRIANPARLSKLSQTNNPTKSFSKMLDTFAERERLQIREQILNAVTNDNILENHYYLANFLSPDYDQQLDQTSIDQLAKRTRRYVDAIEPDLFYRLFGKMSSQNQFAMIRNVSPELGTDPRFLKNNLLTYAKPINITFETMYKLSRWSFQGEPSNLIDPEIASLWRVQIRTPEDLRLAVHHFDSIQRLVPHITFALGDHVDIDQFIDSIQKTDFQKDKSLALANWPSGLNQLIAIEEKRQSQQTAEIENDPAIR